MDCHWVYNNCMDKTQKMLQMIINGQSSLKSELLVRIEKLDKRLSDRIDGLESKMDKGFKEVDQKLVKLTKRVANLGLQIAKLEDDAPTVEEFEKLESRVTVLEEKVLGPL